MEKRSDFFCRKVTTIRIEFGDDCRIIIQSSDFLNNSFEIKVISVTLSNLVKRGTLLPSLLRLFLKFIDLRKEFLYYVY
jgi:hypothetical protein